MYQQSAREGSRISCSRDAGSVGSQNTEVARRRSPSHFQSGCSWASRKRAIRTAPLITSAWPHNSDRVEATRGLPAGPWSGSPQSCGEIWIRSAPRNCRRQLSCTRQGHYPLPEIWGSPAATGSARQNTGQRLRNFAAAHRTAARSAACRLRSGFGSRQLGGDATG